MGGASFFVLAGNVEKVRQKDTGGKRADSAQVWVKLYLPNTSVRPRPTQNIRFNEHLSQFLFPPLSTTKLLAGFRVPVHYIQQQW